MFKHGIGWKQHRTNEIDICHKIVINNCSGNDNNSNSSIYIMFNRPTTVNLYTISIMPINYLIV